jgi:hypothetical protein
LRADFRFDLRAGFFAAAFRGRALPSLLIAFMTASTAAWAAAVAAAVAALTAIFCTRAALDLAAPTIVRWVFRIKLFLAIDVLRKKARLMRSRSRRSEQHENKDEAYWYSKQPEKDRHI